MSKKRAKRKIILDDKYFNYKKICHFERDYTTFTTHKKNKSDNI